MANVRSLAAGPPPLSWQPSLPTVAPRDPRHLALHPRPAWRRVLLDAASWVDTCPSLLTDPDPLFDALLADAPWRAHTVTMYDRVVDEPRLSAWLGAPLPVAATVAPVIAALAAALSQRYGVTFTSVSAALYRDGHDSVAWHGDRVRHTTREPIVAIVSLGSPRRFLLRPRGGGRSLRFVPQPGDALVMGGRAQLDWEHCVPKSAHAGPRISVQLRHG